MNARLEARVAKVVFEAHILERAVHDSGPWYIRLNDKMLPAAKSLRDEAVTFTSALRSSEVVTEAFLFSGDDLVSTMNVPARVFTIGDTFGWTITTPEYQAA